MRMTKESSNIQNYVHEALDWLSSIWEWVKRSKLERVSTSQDFILAINLKNQLISFKDTYYLQWFDQTFNDPDFKESLSELSNLFSMHLQTKSQSYSK